jgi:hypothetical protein
MLKAIQLFVRTYLIELLYSLHRRSGGTNLRTQLVPGILMWHFHRPLLKDTPDSAMCGPNKLHEPRFSIPFV